MRLHVCDWPPQREVGLRFSKSLVKFLPDSGGNLKATLETQKTFSNVKKRQLETTVEGKTLRTRPSCVFKSGSGVFSGVIFTR